MIVPNAGPCTGLINPGGKRTLRRASANRGVLVSAATAEHPGEVAPAFLTDPEKSNLASNAVSSHGGIANGFVVTFTNGLTVYLSGDTGLTSDMQRVVNRFFHVNLTVINISDTFVTGPEEAAFAVRNLIKPKALIPSHANEIATTGGVVNPGTRTARFIELLHQRSNDNNQNSAADNGSNPAVFVPRSGSPWSSMARRAARPAVSEPLLPPRECAVSNPCQRPDAKHPPVKRRVPAARND